MDEDDWIASLDLETLERDFTQHQQNGHCTAVGLRADHGIHPVLPQHTKQGVQWPEPCRASGTQQVGYCQFAAPRSLQAISAADLLRATLPSCGGRYEAAPHPQPGALQAQKQQQWQHSSHQQHQWGTCAPQQHSMCRHTDASSMNQAASNEQRYSGQQQQQLNAFEPAIQQHWPGRPLDQVPESSLSNQPLQRQQQQHQQHLRATAVQAHSQLQHMPLLQQPPQQPAWLLQPQVPGWTGQGQQQYCGPQQQQQSWQPLDAQHHGQQHHQLQQHQCGGVAPQPYAQHQQRHAHQQHMQAGGQPAAEVVPRCPYKVCPGVFSFCGADLVFRKRKESSNNSSGFWGCSTWPGCDFKYFPAQQVPRPELGCEVVDGQHFRLVPQPAAEVAVARAGGIKAVLAAAGITLRHLEVQQPAALPELAAAGLRRQQQEQQHAPLGPAAVQGSGTTATTCGGAAAAPVVAAGREDAAAVAEPALGAAPDFSWSAEDSLLLRLIDYELVVALLTGAKPPLLGKGGAIPPTTLEAFRSPNDLTADAAEVDSLYHHMPASLRAALLPFQQTGVKFGLTRRGRVLIADEMGVGKTVQALALASCYQDEWPLLVVVPASLRLVWAEEIERWLPHVRPGEVKVIEGREDRLCDLPDANARRREKLPAITITSYEMLKRLSCPACQKLPQAQTGTTGGRGGAGSGRGRGRGGSGGSTRAKTPCTGPDHCMAALPWGVVIIDESHNLRTTNSRQADSPHTEAAVAAGSRAGRLILLSGTPSLSRPYDLYRQIDVLVPGLLGRTKEEFAQRYCDRRLVPVITSRGESRLKWNNGGGARLVELHGLLVRRVMIRRLKRDVMAELPPKRRQVVRLPYPPANRWPKEREPGAPAPAGAAGLDSDQPQQQQECQLDQCAAAGSVEASAAVGDSTAAGVMSAAHRVALAKLPDAIDWLMAALGEAAASSGGSGSSGGANKGSTPKVPGGPLKPAWRKDLGSSTSSGDGLAAASGSVDEDGDDDDDGSSSGGGSAGGGSSSSSGQKFLVFAHHRDVMDKLAAALSGYRSGSIDPDDVEAAAAADVPVKRPGRGVGYVRVDGSHDSTERLAAVRKFRSDPSIRVALLSITAAAVGLDFSSASMVVFVELPNEVSLVRQAEDRAHRKGQSTAVNVYFLCAQGTVDDKRWQALNISLSHVSQVHDGQAETLPEPLARAQAADAPPDNTAEESAAGVKATAVHAAPVPECVDNADGHSPAGAEPAENDCSGAVGRAGHPHQQLSHADQQQQQQAGFVSSDRLPDGAAEQLQQQDRQQALEDARPVHREAPGAVVAGAGPSSPSKAVTAAAAELRDGGSDISTPAKAPVVDLTDDSPARVHSSSKRGRQPLDLTPSRAAGAAARATRSPAAAAAALAAIAAAAHSPANKRPRLDANGNSTQSPLGSQQQQQTVPTADSRNVSLPEVWFEVSGHTNRLHYHLSPDGSRPMGLNLPLDWLVLPEEQGTLQQLAHTWDKAQREHQKLVVQQQPQQLDEAAEKRQKEAYLELQQRPQTVGPQVDLQQNSRVLQQQQQQLLSKPLQAQPHAALQLEQLLPMRQRSSPLEVMRNSPRQQQQQQLLQVQPTPVSAAAAASGGLRSSSSGRGAARPAISSLTLLPFASPTRAVAAVARPAAAAGTGGSHQQETQDSVVAISQPAQLQSSPALALRLRRFLQQDCEPQQQQQQQQRETQTLAQQHSSPTPEQSPCNTPQQQRQQDGAAGVADCVTAASPARAQLRFSFSAVDMVAATPSQQEQQQGSAADAAAGDQLQLVLDKSEDEQQQEVVIDDSQEDEQQWGLVGQPDAEEQQQQQHDHELAAAGLPDGQPSQQQQQVISSQPQRQQQQAAVPQQRQQHLSLSQQEQVVSPQPAGISAVNMPDCRLAPGFFGPSGLVCLSLAITGEQLLELLRLGSAFAADWSELRSVTRNRLAGRVVPADLSAAVEAVTAAAAGSGAHGTGTVRYIKDIQEGDPNLPPAATLETVTVHYPAGRQPVVKYRQAFTGPRTRHCINCFKVVEGAVLPADAVLEGGLDLFCSLDCERLYYIKNSSSGIRRALFKLERGVCVLCHLDCHALVKELQQIGKDEPQWMAHRKSIVARMAPKFLERRQATCLERLLNQATAGNAWHADHIIAVYQGGGGCDLDNLRTLCVPCHAAVTKQQAKERAEARARRKLGTHDIRQFLCTGDTKAEGSLNPNVLKPSCAVKRKRRGAGEQLFLDDMISPELQISSKTAKRTAAPAAAGKKSKLVSSRSAAAAVQTGTKPHSNVATADGADEDGGSPQRQQQQQQQDVEVISILSSPSSTSRTAAAPVAAGTPTSALRPAQTRQQASPALCNPPAAPRAAAAAASSAAAAVGGGKQAMKGMRSVLEQFRCGGSDSDVVRATVEPGKHGGQQTQQQESKPQQQQQVRKRGRPPKTAAAVAAAAISCSLGAGSGDCAAAAADDDGSEDYTDELTAAERKQLVAAAEAAIASSRLVGSHANQYDAGSKVPATQNSVSPAAAAVVAQHDDGPGRVTRTTSSSRKAACAAAAAMRRQLGYGRSDSSSSDDELQPQDLGLRAQQPPPPQQRSRGRPVDGGASHVLQEGAANAADNGHGKVAKAGRTSHDLQRQKAGQSVAGSAVGPAGGSKQLQAKRARGGKRARTVLDT